LERGKLKIETVSANVLGNGGGELGGLRGLGSETAANLRGADIDVEAREEVKGGLAAG
jgi:hypothetical protein